MFVADLIACLFVYDDLIYVSLCYNCGRPTDCECLIAGACVYLSWYIECDVLLLPFPFDPHFRWNSTFFFSFFLYYFLSLTPSEHDIYCLPAH